MNGVAKVIDELGRMLVEKEIEIKSKESEINELKKKIELIESYLDTYDKFYNQGE